MLTTRCKGKNLSSKITSLETSLLKRLRRVKDVFKLNSVLTLLKSFVGHVTYFQKEVSLASEFGCEFCFCGEKPDASSFDLEKSGDANFLAQQNGQDILNFASLGCPPGTLLWLSEQPDASAFGSSDAADMSEIHRRI